MISFGFPGVARVGQGAEAGPPQLRGRAPVHLRGHGNLTTHQTSIHLYIRLPVYLSTSIYLPIYLSIYLSIYIQTCRTDLHEGAEAGPPQLRGRAPVHLRGHGNLTTQQI